MTDPPFRNPQSAPRNRQRGTVLSLVTAFVIVLLLVQLWLLVGAVEGYVGGEGAFTFPATLASGLCFVGVWQLWRRLPL
jgi:hypothetical protein